MAIKTRNEAVFAKKLSYCNFLLSPESVLLGRYIEDGLS